MTLEPILRIFILIWWNPRNPLSNVPVSRYKLCQMSLDPCTRLATRSLLLMRLKHSWECQTSLKFIDDVNKLSHSCQQESCSFYTNSRSQSIPWCSGFVTNRNKHFIKVQGSRCRDLGKLYRSQCQTISEILLNSPMCKIQLPICPSVLFFCFSVWKGH